MSAAIPESVPADRLALSIAETARILGLGYNTAAGLVRDGKIPHVLVGRRPRILRSDLEAMLQANRVDAWR